jgi:hypothetical protein
MPSIYKYIAHILGRAILILPVIFLLDGVQVSLAQEPDAGVVWIEPMEIPSPEDARSWFPDLAIDSRGQVHVVWNETKTVTEGEGKIGREVERVFYSTWDGQRWLPFNDIVSPQPDIIRNSITIDSKDTLHFVYGWLALHYKQVQADEAISAAAWSSPRLVNSRGSSYMNDTAIYQDVLHVIYDDAGEVGEDGICLGGCADIFYRRSPDAGHTWEAPVALFPTGKGSSRAQIEIDRAGVIHVTWDEGWDRLSGNGSPETGVYMHSLDGGTTWSEPTIISYPNSTNAQLSVGSDGRGGVLLVWRTVSAEYPGLYYMWSTDQGKSWSPPRSIPHLLARDFTSPFDMYDMATDSAGHIHLMAVGYRSEDLEQAKRAENSEEGKVTVPPSLYHLMWDGQSWSEATPLYKGAWYPEYPHLAVHQGNQLHATWFIRQNPFEVTEPHQIWYIRGQAQAPEEASIVQPTPTPLATPTPSPTPAPSPTPTLEPSVNLTPASPEATQTIYTEVDDVFLMAQSLLPALLIVIVVVVTVRLWRR